MKDQIMKDQIIHTLIISVAILGAGFVIGMIIKDKSQVSQVVAKAKRQVISSDDAALLKELVIANERQENELAQRDEKIIGMRSAHQSQINTLRRMNRNYNVIVDKARKGQSALKAYDDLANLMKESLRYSVGKDYDLRDRINEIAKENRNLMENAKWVPDGRTGPIGSPRPTHPARLLNSKDKVKYYENRMLVAALLFTVQIDQLKRLAKPVLLLEQGELIPLPSSATPRLPSVLTHPFTGNIPRGTIMGAGGMTAIPPKK